MDAAAAGDLVAAPAIPRLPVRDLAGRLLGTFPVRRIYCVGRNFADHAREMGAAAPASKAERGTPVFFMKPADAIVVDGEVAYPPGTQDLHHEVELVVALGHDAPPGELPVADAARLVVACGVGLDLTRRDLQAIAKDKRLPWDVSKGFDASAPVSALRHVDDIGHPTAGTALWLEVNGERRQASTLDEMIFTVDDVLVHLSTLFRLRAGDLVFMGTPAGVAALQRGDRFRAALDGVAELTGEIA